VSAEAAANQKVLAELSAPELEVLHLMADGLDSNAVAQHLAIASRAVEDHVKRVIEKLGSLPPSGGGSGWGA
jgi:DNA-binding NarL/FixJ family response regulator